MANTKLTENCVKLGSTLFLSHQSIPNIHTLLITGATEKKQDNSKMLNSQLLT